jgi:hypothetical protein
MDERIRTELYLVKGYAAVFWTRLMVALDGTDGSDADFQDELRELSSELVQLSLRLAEIASR